MNINNKVMIISIPIIIISFFGIAYIEAVGELNNYDSITYMGDCGTSSGFIFGGIYGVLCDIREQNEIIIREEQKQTALLDHIDCVSTYGGSTMYFTHDLDRIERCGHPLNITGGYKP